MVVGTISSKKWLLYLEKKLWIYKGAWKSKKRKCEKIHMIINKGKLRDPIKE